MKEKTKSKLVIEIENKIKNLILQNDFILVDIDIIGGKTKNITLYLYHKDSIDTQKLESASKIIYPVIKEIPFFNDGFNLELSTPGIFRDIKYLEEFNIFKGKKLKIVDNSGKVFFGISAGLRNDILQLIIDGKAEFIKTLDIKSAKLNG